MDNRQLCLPGDIALTYNVPYVFKLLLPELFFLILAHPVYKM
jgi:hypothetical protein